MALFGNVDAEYTKTGKGGLTSFANKLSFIPFLRDFGRDNLLGEKGKGFLAKIPLVGGSITFLLGQIDTFIEAGKWLLKGKFASAATVLAAGTVSNAINSASDDKGFNPLNPFYWANVASGVATGASLGTHSRALTENIIGGVTGALGMKPEVLQSYPAAIGSINASAFAGPGKFATKVSNERGQNADQAYQQYMNGEGGVHVNELGSAYAAR